MGSPLLFIACGDSFDEPNNEKVKGGELFVNFPASAIKLELLGKGLIDENRTVYGYKAYKIPYTTTNEEGNEVDVSGLLVLPIGLPSIVNSTLGLSMVSDGHGAIFKNSEAPSVIADETGAPSGSSVLFTSLGGFATLQSDYIGFGDSKNDYHPFLLKKSSADTTIDFIEQVKIFSKENNITLNNQLFLTGYSEGGYTTMATLQKIEEENELFVSMAIPMAGPYALESVVDGVLSQPKLEVPSFIANIGYAYVQSHDQELRLVINEPYASTLPILLNGDINRSEIDSKLTKITTGEKGLFVSKFVNDYFTKDTHWFKNAMRTNSVHAWKANTPIRLLHCKKDEIIPYSISELTEITMNAMGARDVKLISVEETLGMKTEAGHIGCGTLAYSLATTLFATVRKETIGY